MRLCSFQIGPHLFGVPIEQVREVLRPQPMARVPTAPPAVRGLLNLRGEIVVAVDLRVRLGLPPIAEPLHVVVMTSHGTTSLLVDDVGDVRDAAPGAVEPTPATTRGPLAEIVRSVVKLPDGLLLVVEVDRAASVDAGRPTTSGAQATSTPHEAP